MVASTNIKRAGLCVYDTSTKDVFCLKRKRPYTQDADPKFFIEQFSIPRGKCARHTESLRECAIREFIEETGFYFKKIHIYDDIFQLFWNDPKHVRWEYSIFFASADFSKANIIKINKMSDNNALMLARVKSKRYEHVFPVVLHVNKYVSLLRKRLELYGRNNYDKFINILMSRIGTIIPNTLDKNTPFCLRLSA